LDALIATSAGLAGDLTAITRADTDLTFV